MPQKTFRSALNEALHQEMAADPRVVLFGEDITGGKGGDGEEDAWGGAFGGSQGPPPKFRPNPGPDTPITQSAFFRAAARGAVTGPRPGVVLIFLVFIPLFLPPVTKQARQ